MVKKAAAVRAPPAAAAAKRTRRSPKLTKKDIIISARSSWINFVASVRNEARPEYTGLAFGELCKILSPVWKKMDLDQREPYIQAYREDRDRYIRELGALTDKQKKILRVYKRDRRKAKKDMPTLALSSYMQFGKAKRPDIVATNPEASFEDIGRMLGKAWRDMDDAAKAPYYASSEADRKRYREEMDAYRAARKKSVQ